MSDKTLCSTCMNSVWCPTWGEVKCRARMRRIYDPENLVSCTYHKRRGKDFKEPVCHCESCLENEALWDDDEEEG